MTFEQSAYALLVALALVCAGMTPSRAQRDVFAAAAVVGLSWVLCLWAGIRFDYTPAQLATNLTRDVVDPFRIQAVQDAIFSLILWSTWMKTRGRVSLIVGLLFTWQLVVHLIAHLTGIDRQPWLNTLFVAQLAAISVQGAKYSGERIRAWARRHRHRRVGYSHGRLGLPGIAGGIQIGDRSAFHAGPANSNRASV